MTPLVSLIVPIYHVRDFIGQCARSVFSQTWKDMEFIFIDDCSNDGSLEILESVIDNEFPSLRERIRIVRNERNLGIAAVREIGLDLAEGDYVAHVDSDDWVEPDMIEKMVHTATETGSDLVYCDLFKNYEKRSTKILKEAEYDDVRILIKDLTLGRKFHGYLCNKLVHKSLYKKQDIARPAANAREDVVYVSQWAWFAKKITHLPIPLYHYRKDNGGSMLHRGKKAFSHDGALNQLAVFDFYRHKTFENPVGIIRDTFLLQTGRYMINSKDKELIDSRRDVLALVKKIPFGFKNGMRADRQIKLKLSISRLGI